MDFPTGPCSLSLNCKVPTHELRKKCPGCQGYIHALCGRVLSEDEGKFKEDEVVCPKCDNSNQPTINHEQPKIRGSQEIERKPLPKTVQESQSKLFQHGFRKLTKQEIQQKKADRAALYDPVAVKEKQDALREASKAKAEEAAAAKADKERYLNMKRQSRFRMRERMKKAKARTEEKKEDEESTQFSALPFAMHSQRPNWYDPLYWNDILVALQEAEFNTRKAV